MTSSEINQEVRKFFVDSIDNPLSWFVFVPPNHAYFKPHFRERKSFVQNRVGTVTLYRGFNPYCMEYVVAAKRMVIH